MRVFGRNLNNYESLGYKAAMARKEAIPNDDPEFVEAIKGLSEDDAYKAKTAWREGYIIPAVRAFARGHGKA